MNIMSYFTVVCRLVISGIVKEVSTGIAQLRADLEQVTTHINDGHSNNVHQQLFVPLSSYIIPVRIIE